MKKIIKYIGIFVSGLLLLACENNLPSFSDTENRLNFVFEDHIMDSATHFTFIYTPSTQRKDTVFVEVQTSGYLVGHPRKVTFRQVASEGVQAEAGVHYVAFDDPSLADSYVIPANKNGALLPIVLLRDTSLTNMEVNLKVEIVENEYFKAGYLTNKYKAITISDILTRPANWTGYVTYYITGKYGEVKHQFMIDAGAAHGIKIDEEFFKTCGADPYNPDMGLTGYWNSFFVNALKEENAARAAAGLEPLREKRQGGETEGRLVEFNMYDPSDF